MKVIYKINDEDRFGITVNDISELQEVFPEIIEFDAVDDEITAILFSKELSNSELRSLNQRLGKVLKKYKILDEGEDEQ